MTNAKRYLSLYFPRLSTDRLARSSQAPLAGPLALTRNVNGRIVLAALNKAAEAQGLRPAMPMATAAASASTNSNRTVTTTRAPSLKRARRG